MNPRYFTSRYVCPFFVGIDLTLILGGAIGIGLTFLLDWNDARGVVLVGTCALSSVGAAAAIYRRSDATKRRTIFDVLTALWFGSFSTVFGGIPGSLLGHAIAGELGGMIGWFATAIVAGIAGFIWGWRYSKRFDPEAVAAGEGR